MSKTVRTMISCISALLVIALLCGVIAWIARSQGLDVYVGYNDKKYLSTDKNSSLGQMTSGEHIFAVRSLTGEKPEYEVKITPNADKPFEYMTGGSVYTWKSKRDTDFKEYFGYKETNTGFIITVADGMTVQSILENNYGEAEIITDAEYLNDYFLLTVTCDKAAVTLSFGIPLLPPSPAKGVVITPDHITF